MRRKISNTEEANQYYSIINKLIDNYIDEWKIKPSKLRNYFKRGGRAFKSFLEKNGLSDIDNIEVVFNDIIDDRQALEFDGVLKFESFSTEIEDYTSLGLSNPDFEYEKILADYYHTSIGHISVYDKENHIFRVKDFGVTRTSLILSKEDIEKIKKDIRSSIKKKILDLKTTVSLGEEISIPLKISQIYSGKQINYFLENKIDSSILVKYIHAAFPNNNFTLKGELNGYLIFE